MSNSKAQDTNDLTINHATQITPQQLQVSKFAGMAKMQYMKGRKDKLIPIDVLEDQLREYINMDNMILQSELQTQGYTQDQIDAAISQKFKPTTENIIKLLIDLKKQNKRQSEIINELGLMVHDQDFLSKFSLEKHIINRNGNVYLSNTLVTVLLVKLTEIGFSIGIYILETLKLELDKHLPIADGTNLTLDDANLFNGYSKATFVNLKDLLMDFSFIDTLEIEEGLVPEHLQTTMQHEGLLKALGKAGQSSTIRENQKIPDMIQYFERVANVDNNTVTIMESLGFTCADKIGGLNLISFYSLNLKPTAYLISLIQRELVRVVICHIKNGRGKDFKFESLEIEGSQYSDFYRVLSGNCERSRHENKALRLGY